ncbi:cathepsin O isoform X2 [Anabrus simplex]|uniref:cathepsin O isoform X2 n=1 Tax=Anabrus simplex TaxID=316456 RepID=UPI0035A3C1C7
MAVEWKNVWIFLGVVALCFLAIPIRIDKSDSLANEKLFQSYIKKFNKTYESNVTEYNLRLLQFQESLTQIKILNGERQSESSALYGFTKFSDLSPDEFLHHHLQPKLHERLHHRHKSHKRIEKRAIDSLPLRVDWREKKIVTPIRDQKACGACWAFSTVETVESMSAIKTGVLQSLSVQEIIDCAGNGNMGCSGGDTCGLLEWLVGNKISIRNDKEYPLMWKTQACKLKGSESGVQVAPNYTCQYLVGNEEALLATLAYHGPVIAAINALSWQNYLGGVIQFHCDSSLEHINHAVQIVGYDRSGDVPHYIVRNSWGPEFGDKGYIYIAIGSNVCGLASEVSTLDVL